jgi:hypothetical protein
VYPCPAIPDGGVNSDQLVESMLGSGAWSGTGTLGDPPQSDGSDISAQSGLGGGVWSGPIDDHGLSSVCGWVSACAIWDNISAKSGLGGGAIWDNISAKSGLGGCAIWDIISAQSGLDGGAWSGMGTLGDPPQSDGSDPIDDHGLSSVGGWVSACAIWDHVSAKSGLGDHSLSSVGGWVSVCAIWDNISAKSGLGGGEWSDKGTSGDPPKSIGSHRFCDAAATFLLTFASRRASGLSRTATGAASAKLMMKSISRV